MTKFDCRYLWTGQRIEKFYDLLVKDVVTSGSIEAVDTKENRQRCRQIHYDFKNSWFYSKAYTAQTLVKLVICIAVISSSVSCKYILKTCMKFDEKLMQIFYKNIYRPVQRSSSKFSYKIFLPCFWLHARMFLTFQQYEYGYFRFGQCLFICYFYCGWI